MNYIVELLKILPILVVVTGVIYFVVFAMTKNKRDKITKQKILFEILLVGWLVTFVYVTLVQQFGNDMGRDANLKPFRPFYIALKYGVKNAGMLEQFHLNMLMVVPLGILLPLVFSHKCKGFFSVFCVAFITIVLTELSQLLIGRAMDVDDIIANTVGGAVGYIIYYISSGIRQVFKKKDRLPKFHMVKLFLSLIFITMVVVPYFMIKYVNMSNSYGYVYYGHIQPENIEITSSLSEKETTKTVYKYKEIETLESLKERLLMATGFSGKFTDNNSTLSLEDGTNRRIFIYDYNTWSVYYDYGEDNKTDEARLPGKKQAMDIALSCISGFGIDEDSIVFKKIDDSYEDNNLHLVFEGKENAEALMVTGHLLITIGEDEKILDVTDNRIPCTKYKEVTTISPKDSISIAKDIGLGKRDGTAYVDSVKDDYYFNEDTGYLIPTWRVHAKFVADSGAKYEWVPNIDAIK